MKIRIGCVPYTNALPLIYYLHPDLTEIDFQVPSELSKRFEVQAYDVALIPAFEWVLNENYQLISNLGIVSRGPVNSVVLYSDKKLTDIKKIKLDKDSKTSNALIEVLFKNYFKLKPKFTLTEEDYDAELLIGDKSLKDKSPFKRVLDLGAAWHEWTKLPFVFAAWMNLKNEGQEFAAIEAVLRSAYEMGKKNLAMIINSTAKEKHFSKKLIDEYFSKNIFYEIGPEELEGLKRFKLECQQVYERGL